MSSYGALGKPLNDPLQPVEDAVARLQVARQSLETTIGDLGTPKDTPALRRRLNAERQAVRKLIGQTEEQLRSVKSSFINKPPEEKRRFERTNKSFIDLRRQIEDSLLPLATQRERQTRGAGAGAAADELGSGSGAGAGAGAGAGGAGAGERKLQFQEEKLRAYDYSALDTEARVQEDKLRDIREVTDDLADLRDVFQDGALLVQEQEKDVEKIATDVHHANTAVEKGSVEIRVANTYQAKSRKKLCCIALFAVIALAVIIVVITLATKLSS
eukprot:TRINITY_DN25562_c0_g1_i1.p1 TRINITY_DN25562_c0_g1~~TRINITY_DN25562_c0_g1_i1.p1  ORF type:complete len:272 (-),score=56.38 TRINITY_DN25562_c0_g1_i1:215-1030(-)